MKRSPVDPYFYPGTTVLRNYLDIRHAAELEATERLIVGLLNDKLFLETPKPPHDLAGSLCSIKHSSADFIPLLESFANIPEPWPKCARLAIPFLMVTLLSFRNRSPSSSVGWQRRTPLLAFNKIPSRFGQRIFMVIDAVHPFREGNSRTLRLFFSGLAYTSGYRFDWRILAAQETGRNTLYAARDRAVMHGDSTPLATLFASILSQL